MINFKMDDSQQNGNTNCVNVVALDIAREMINDKQNTETNESVLSLSERLEQLSTNSDNQSEVNEQSISNGTNPEQRQSYESCVSIESGGSFTGQPENSLQFVEYQQPTQNFTPTTPYPIQYPQAIPYYLYNGQLYNATVFYPYGQQVSPYVTYNGQSFPCYQMQPAFMFDSGTAFQTSSQENFSNVPYSSETGSDEEPNNNTNTIKSTEGRLDEVEATNENVLVADSDIRPETNAINVTNQNIEQHQEANPQTQPTQNETCVNENVTLDAFANPHFNNHQQGPPYMNGNPAEQSSQIYQYHSQSIPNLNSFQHVVENPPTEFQPTYFQHPNVDSHYMGNKQVFQYPAIYVSTTGLITVLMKYDVSVETTVEQALRLVSHQQKLVVSMNSRGNASYLFHPAAHIMQDLTTTEAEIFLGRKVKMTTAYITFANNFNCYKFDYARIDHSSPDFTDLSKDKSVSFLFSEAQPNQDLLQQCSEIISRAEYERSQKGGICIRINGFKIVQTVRGDVIVTGKGKYLRMSPTTSVLRLDTNFVQMDVEMNWNIRIKRGAHSVNASHLGFIVSNGKVEAAFDENNKVHACRLPSRRPLTIGGAYVQSRRNSVDRSDQ